VSSFGYLIELLERTTKGKNINMHLPSSSPSSACTVSAIHACLVLLLLYVMA
jgi:hypothetical protein